MASETPPPRRRPSRPSAQPGRPARPPRSGAPRNQPAARRRRPDRAPRRKRSFLWRWRRALFAVGLLGFAGIAGSLYYLSRLPLPQPQPQSQTTFVYDSSGKTELASFQIQNRVNVSLSQVPQVVVNAVVSTEDRHFFTEGAINPISILRALVSDVRGNGNLQGGSTITQQYVKQAYLNSQRTLTRKIKEAAIAVKLSHVESKDQILQGYLNTIYWGRGAYGVEAASRVYFHKDVGQLGLPEASLLAGLIREPETADPANDPALAKANQAASLKAMVRDKKITSADATRVEAMPLGSYVYQPSQSAIAASQLPGGTYFVEAVRQELIAKYGSQLVDGGGLRVTTTIDPTLQAQAYDSVYGNNSAALDPAKGDPSGALVAIDDQGEVKAMVGGQNYTQSQVNLALGRPGGPANLPAGGGSGRQAGSTFKAFMLAEVIKEGYSVQSTFPAPPEVVVPHGNANGTPWQVKNFEGEAGSNAMTLIDATAQSVNTVYAQVVERIGADKLNAMAESLGINPSEIAGAYPSQVLGTASVSPLEMAAAYATFADGGIYHTPVLITKVTRADGSPLPLPVTRQTKQVLTPQQAALESYVLQQVVLGGTGGAAGGLGTPVAGKTGTTENSTDAWFIGYTPKLTAAMWMGYPKASTPMINFRGLKSVQGGTIPAQIWHNFMSTALGSQPGYEGSFPLIYSYGGQTLLPPPAGSLEFPLGMGSTTTTSTSSTTTATTSTTVATTSTTAAPSTTATTATTHPYTPPTATVPTTTVPTTSRPAVTTTTTRRLSVTTPG